MRKIVFLVFIAAVVNLQNMFAEVPPTKISIGTPDLAVQIKRCVADEKIVLVDLVFTNKTDDDVDIRMGNVNIMNAFVIYDSEGNSYTGGKRLIRCANNPFTEWEISFLALPEIPVKVQIKVVGVPTEAEFLSLIKLPIHSEALGLSFLDMSHTGKYPSLRNIPITRN